MAKRRYKQNKARRNRQSEPRTKKGFDFGEHLTVMAVTDLKFNQALSSAGVFGCAYSYEQMAGFSCPIPVLTLIGENRRTFERAFEHFARWGCQEDGDTVDINLILKLDGTYEMWIGPEIKRAIYRTVPQASLCRPLMYGVSWVKSFDSTHRMVHVLKEYCKLQISPVVVTAAIANPEKPDRTQIEPIYGLPRLVKFELKIITEGEAANDPRFHFQKKHPKSRQVDAIDTLSPREYCKLRAQTFDVAFPVSRERVRRSGLLSRVREMPGFADVSQTQVVQAAINLMISSNLVPGDQHYRKITSELPQKVWDHIGSRYEIANDQLEPADQELTTVAHQLELDVRYVLMQHGISTARKEFGNLQATFRQEGYIND